MEGGGTSNRLNMFFFSRGKRDLNKFAPAISLKPKSGRCNPPKNVNMLICNPPKKPQNLCTILVFLEAKNTHLISSLEA